MGNIGFSYIGMVWLLMLFIPNSIWAKNKPVLYDKLVKNEKKVLVLLERVGQVLVTCCALAFKDFNLTPLSVWSVWLALSLFLMLVYEICWVRYFRSGCKLTIFYSNLLYIPVPLASLPVTAFFLLGIYGKVIWMMLAVIPLAIGHIGIHLQHRSSTLLEDSK